MSRIGRATTIVLAVSALALAAGTAQADEVAYTANYGPFSIPSSGDSISLPLFDPLLGTLVEVKLELLASTSSGTIAWDNEAAVVSDITLGIGAEVTAADEFGALNSLVATPLQTGSSTVDADNDGAADFLGTDSFSVTGGSGNDDDSDSSTDSGVLAMFTGTFGHGVSETFDVDISSIVETFLSTSGGFGPIDPVPGVTDGQVKVTYIFVPEPATMALLGMGGVGLIGAIRRRRRA